MRVRTPVDEFQEPEISEVSEKARTSSPDWNPEEMVTVADSRFVSSTSASVREASMTEAPSPSVKARVSEASEIVGASFTNSSRPDVLKLPLDLYSVFAENSLSVMTSTYASLSLSLLVPLSSRK